MEDWFYYSLSIALCGFAISFLVVSLRPATGGKRPAAATPSLPPGPTALTAAAFGPLLLLAWTSVNIESAVRVARRWYGPVFTVYLPPSSPVVFVADRGVARHVLVQRGAAFADRPPPTHATRIFSSDGHNITTCAYGPLWCMLRRNLTGRILHPSSVRQYAAARRSAAQRLVAGITTQMLSGPGVVVLDDHLHRAVFHVMITMCFGVGLDDGVIASVTSVQREFLSTAVGFQVFGAHPSALTKLLFRRRYQKMMSIRRRHEELFVPLIRAARCRARHAAAAADNNDDDVACYVDSLLDLTVSDNNDVDVDSNGGGGRRNNQLTESEMVSLCTEFLSGGADSTITALQWTMANVVARPEIQAKLRAEIRHVVGAGAGTQLNDDEHLSQMPYLRAVVLEALRRHPPGRFMVPRAATEAGSATLHGFTVPRHVPVNFTLGDMAMDEAVWPEPREFRPERFLPGGEGQDVDLTGSREIKMMPFGAGRRMCPGVDVSLLHLEWFVATMVREFEWTEMPGEPVDFAEKLVLTMVMARPLRVMAAVADKL